MDKLETKGRDNPGKEPSKVSITKAGLRQARQASAAAGKHWQGGGDIAKWGSPTGVPGISVPLPVLEVGGEQKYRLGGQSRPSC